jgi:cytochrome c-type biogenesis protein CcmH
MWLVLTAILAVATAAPPQADVEAAARRLEAQLVAPCCWSQQVSVHQSPASDEIKRDVRARLVRGESEQQILDDYVVQFGTRILVEPPARGFNWALYLLPPVMLVAGAGIVLALVRRFSSRRTAAGAANDTEAATPSSSNDAYARRLEDELADLD